MFLKLDGPEISGPYSILGKAITLYENEDDFGYGNNAESKINGNVGKPIACCNIRPLEFLLDASYIFEHRADDRRRLKSNK